MSSKSDRIIVILVCVNARIQYLKDICSNTVLAHCIKYIKKITVFLTIYLLQLYRNVFHILQCLGVKEIWGRVYLRHELSFIFLHDRGELLCITDHQELYSSEGPVIATIPSQGHVDCVEQVCPDHGYFIDYKQVESTDYLYPLFSKTAVTLRSLIFCYEFLYIRKIRT